MTPGDSQNGTPRIRIAAIDLGTNSFHAIIVDIYPDGSYRIIDTFKELVELGASVAEHRLSEEAMERGIAAMRKIKMLCEHQGVDDIIANATSAIRESTNGGVFIQRVIDEAAIKILPIPGEKEAELIGYAVQHAIKLDDEPVLMMDIGGGSVEFIIGNRDRFFALESRKIGVSRTAAQFVHHDPVSEKEIREMVTFYEKQLAPVAEAVRKYPVTTLIGSSGTMENIAAMVAARKSRDTSVTINEYTYTPQDFETLFKSFLKLNHKQRLDVSGLDAKRVDFIVPGLILVDLVIRKFGITRVKTSSEALRDGMILQYISRELKGLQLVGHYPDPRKRSVYELLRKCNWHQRHSRQVAKIALKLFDSTREYHGLADNDRELLEYAALMHDIGYHISHRKHHKHALYLIQNADLKGFQQDEIQIMANVARYHRRSTPKKRHEQYAGLPSAVKSKIRKLSAFMRVADGLDRSHYQNVRDFDLKMRPEKVVITIYPRHDAELEVWGAERKKELFEDLFHRKLEVLQAPPLDTLQVSQANGAEPRG